MREILRELLSDESRKWSANRFYAAYCGLMALICTIVGLVMGTSSHTFVIGIVSVWLGSASGVLLGSAWKAAKVKQGAFAGAPPDVPEASQPKRKYTRRPNQPKTEEYNNEKPIQ